MENEELWGHCFSHVKLNEVMLAFCCINTPEKEINFERNLKFCKFYPNFAKVAF